MRIPSPWYSSQWLRLHQLVRVHSTHVLYDAHDGIEQNRVT